MDIPTSEERISTTRWSTTVWLTSRRRLVSTSLRTTDLSEDLEPSARRPRESCPVHIRPQSSVKLWLKVRTITITSLEPSSKSYVWIFSESACHQLRTCLRTLESEKVRFMRLFWSEDPLEFLRSNPCSQTSSTERPLTRVSTQMRPSPMEPLSRPPF